MGETNTGLRSVLATPVVYEAWSRIVGGHRGRSTLVAEHVRPRPGDRVLDLGCGPGELVPYFGDVRYVGVDVSPAYIERAAEQHGDRAQFLVGDATALDPALVGFDAVIAFGVLHHIDDGGVARLFSSARRALAPGGRMVTVDPTRVPEQGRAARFVIDRDRGQHVREPGDYERLAAATFDEVTTTVRQDLLRIPYTHCVLECTAAGPPA